MQPSDTLSALVSASVTALGSSAASGTASFAVSSTFERSESLSTTQESDASSADFIASAESNAEGNANLSGNAAGSADSQTSADEAQSTQDSASSSTPTTAIAIGATAGSLAIVLGVLFLCIRRNRKLRGQETQSWSGVLKRRLPQQQRESFTSGSERSFGSPDEDMRERASALRRPSALIFGASTLRLPAEPGAAVSATSFQDSSRAVGNTFLVASRTSSGSIDTFEEDANTLTRPPPAASASYSPASTSFSHNKTAAAGHSSTHHSAQPSQASSSYYETSSSTSTYQTYNSSRNDHLSALLPPPPLVDLPAPPSSAGSTNSPGATRHWRLLDAVRQEAHRADSPTNSELSLEMTRSAQGASGAWSASLDQVPLSTLQLQGGQFDEDDGRVRRRSSLL